jgi:hypothetical protein
MGERFHKTRFYHREKARRDRVEREKHEKRAQKIKEGLTCFFCGKPITDEKKCGWRFVAVEVEEPFHTDCIEAMIAEAREDQPPEDLEEEEENGTEK